MELSNITSMNTPAPWEIRDLLSTEKTAAREVMRELRPQLDDGQYWSLLEAQEKNAGYQMFGAWAQGQLIGVLGYRWTENFVRGLYLYIDDLVVISTWRKRGVGEALLAHGDDLARARGVTCVMLVAAPEAEGFYERIGFQPHMARLYRRDLP